MPREFTRAERVSDAVQQEVAVLIRDEVRDPRVGMVNITDVEISRDLAYGKIFVTFVEEREQQQIDEGIAALNGASGYLRKLLAGQHLSALIDLAVSKESPADNEES
jgi:ribosome-binding factor A